MPKTHQIAVLLWFAALAVAIALTAATLLFPDASRATLWASFITGITIAVLLVITAIVVAISDKGIDKTKRFSRKLLGTMVATGLLVIAFALGFFWPRDAFNTSMPGFTAYSALRFFDSPDFKRKYLFDYQTPEGAAASFYISASDMFTFSIKDIRGESYPLEIPVSSGKIPLNNIIVIFCQVGLPDDGTTILRVVVNQKEVQRRTIPSHVELGAQQWNKNTLGPGSMRLFEDAVWATALPNDGIHKIVWNVSEYLKTPLR